MEKSSRISIILSAVLFIALLIFSFVSARHDWPLFYAKLLWSLAISCFGFFIYRSGTISKYRSILFILIAAFFFIQFKFFRFIAFDKTTIPPFCHIAEAPTLLNFTYSQFLAMTSGQWRVWGPLTLGFLWLLLIFTIGRGICSWVCFYGGIDEACSKIAKKPLIKLKIPRPWRDFPIAFLIFLLIVSFLQGLPIFCSWFCPFKMTEAFWDTWAPARIIQAILFWLVLIGFVVMLPVLTKKRTFCGLICPFGALVSICTRTSLHRVTIDKAMCTRCGKCQDICPVLAVEDNEMLGYKISNFCNMCGKCVDECPSGAIKIVFGKAAQEIDARVVFIFMSFLVTGVVSGSFVPQVFLKLMGIK